MNFDRRQFLSGLGVTLALPWLESSAMAEAPLPQRPDGSQADGPRADDARC